jgi:hypothetical protein
MKNTVFKITALVLFSALMFCGRGSTRLSGETDGGGSPREEAWLEVYIRGTKAGYTHLVKEGATFRDQTAIGYKTEMYGKVSRFDVVLESYVMEIDYVDEELKPLGFVKVLRLEEMKEKFIEGVIEKGELRLEIREGDELDRKTLTLPEDFLFEDVAYEKLRASGYEIGETVSFYVFNENSMGFIPMTAAVVEKIADAVVIHSGVSGKGAYTMKTFVTPAGHIVKVEYPDLGMTMVKADKETAEAEFPGLAVMSFTVKTNRRIRNPEALRRLKLDVIIDEEDPKSLFVIDDRQRIEMKGNACILEIESFSPKNYRASKLPLTEEADSDIKPFLERSDMIQSDDPALRQEARSIAGAETDVWVLSTMISEKTRKLLSPSYDLGYASALDAMRQGKGDCTEHAMVFAALARSLGIPVKVCYGMVYDVHDSFMFHAWNEVYVGRWVPIDAALAQNRVDATHIALHKGDGSTSDLEFGLKMVKLRGRLEFKVKKSSYWIDK